MPINSMCRVKAVVVGYVIKRTRYCGQIHFQGLRKIHEKSFEVLLTYNKFLHIKWRIFCVFPRGNIFTMRLEKIKCYCFFAL